MRLRLLATEPSIHAPRVSTVTAVGRVVYADTSKNEATWYRVLRHCDAGFDTAPRVFEG